MDSIWIRGKRPLYGEMTVQGSKNAYFDRRKDDTAKLPGYFGCGLHVPHFAENRRNSDKNRSRDLRGRFRCAAKQASGRGSGSDAFLHRADGRAFGAAGAGVLLRSGRLCHRRPPDRFASESLCALRLSDKAGG